MRHPARHTLALGVLSAAVAVLLGCAPALAQESGQQGGNGGLQAPGANGGDEPGRYHIGDFVATGAAELDWRFTALDCNRAYYRSQVDLQRGPTLSYSRFELRDPDNEGEPFDSLLVEGQGWGGEPNSSARVRAEKHGLYTADYVTRRVDTYNFVPDFANATFGVPLLAVSGPRSGVAPGALAGAGTGGAVSFVAPHGWDRTRWMQTASLTLFPKRRVEGHIVYDDSRQSGLALGTYADNPALVFDRSLDNHAREIRGGVAVRFPRYLLFLDQSYRVYRNDEADGADALATLDPETLASFARTQTQTSHLPTSRASLTANPFGSLRLTARATYTDLGADATFGQSDDAVGSDATRQDFASTSSGHAFLFDSRQSYVVFDRVTLENFARYRRYRTSSALAGLTTSGGDPASATTIAASRDFRVATASDEPTVEVEIRRGLVARVGYRFARRDSYLANASTELAPGASDAEIESTLDRDDYRADVFLASAAYRLRHDARLYVEYENGREPGAFFGTQHGFRLFDRPGDYQLLRVRGALHPRDWIELSGSVRSTDRTFHSWPLNDLLESALVPDEAVAAGLPLAGLAGHDAGIPVPAGLQPPLEQTRSRGVGFTVRVTPDPRYALGVTYDHVRDTAGITFQTAVSRGDAGDYDYLTLYQRYVDDEDLVTADVTAYPHERVTLYGLYSLVSASGSVPVHYHQAQLRGLYRFGRGVSGVLEWRLYDYSDARYDFAHYSANHAVAGVRWEW